MTTDNEWADRVEAVGLEVTDDGKIPEAEVEAVVFDQLVHEGKVTPSQIIETEALPYQVEELDGAWAIVEGRSVYGRYTDEDEAREIAAELNGDTARANEEQVRRAVLGEWMDDTAAAVHADDASEAELAKMENQLPFEPSVDLYRETAALIALRDFLDGRTVGLWETNSRSGPPYAWHWRGQGYDEGWERMTSGEVLTFSRLCLDAMRVGR